MTRLSPADVVHSLRVIRQDPTFDPRGNMKSPTPDDFEQTPPTDPSPQLSPAQLSRLFTALTDSQTPLDAVLSSLIAAPLSAGLDRGYHFALSATLSALIRDKLLPEQSQRLIAIYVLFHISVS
mmetsp:Transcript_17764/g.45099  ORF Transcript_17764/g.45099 Transcript_17764/m.45099 type:complete len:124 (-) Transcript_17764:644-1015(-)